MTKNDLIFPAFSLRFLDFTVQFCFRCKFTFPFKSDNLVRTNVSCSLKVNEFHVFLTLQLWLFGEAPVKIRAAFFLRNLEDKPLSNFPSLVSTTMVCVGNVS